MLWDVVHPDADPDQDLAEGTTFDVAGTALLALHTPGHSPGSTCLYAPELDTVFTGDTLFCGGPGATGRSYSDKPTILDSIRERLLTLPGDTVVQHRARRRHGRRRRGRQHPLTWMHPGPASGRPAGATTTGTASSTRPARRPGTGSPTTSREFDTVELNASFYRWPRTRPSPAGGRLPDGLRLAVKAPRGLTHAKRLLHQEVWIGRIAAAWHALGDRAACCWSSSPPTSARRRPAGVVPGRLPPWIRVAVEFRHASWHDDAVFGLLERHGAAYCVMSGAGLPCVLRATAPFVYVRWHGPDHEHLYAGSYSDDDLDWWADRIREWRGTDVFGYFNNDGEGHAVRNARRLRELLG